MRVCFVSRRYWPAVSGMSVYAEKLLTELAARGHDVVLVSQFRGDDVGRAVYGGGPPPPESVPVGVRAVAVEALGEQRATAGAPADFPADIRALRETVLDLHTEKPFDLLHAQYAWPTGAAVLGAAEALDLPAVVSVQGGDGHWVGLCCPEHSRGIRAVLDRADAVLIGSRSFAEEVTEHHGTHPHRFTLVGGATDTAAFHPADEDAAGAVATGAGPLTLLFHGRVDRRKGVLDLLHAVAALRGDGRDVRLIVSGIGPDVDAVSDLTRTLGLTGAVDQLGHVSHRQAPEVYRRADVFCSPTSSEGFSNTVLEAMASGLPVVTTRTTGVVDCVRHEENGLLHEVGDVTGLTAAVARLLDEPALGPALAARALSDVRTLWSWPALADRVEAAYGQVLTTGRAGRPAADSAGRGVEPAPSLEPCRFLAEPHLL